MLQYLPVYQIRKILSAVTVVELRIDHKLRCTDSRTERQQLLSEKKSMVSLFRGRKGWLSGGEGGWGVWEGMWQQMVQI